MAISTTTGTNETELKKRRADRATGEKPLGSVRIQSVDRALSVLEALAEGPGASSLADVSARAGLNASTCHHLLTTLSARGYVTRDPATRTYSLGNKVFQLSAARARQIDVVRLASDTLAKLNAETGEAVHLAAMQGRELVTLAKLDSRHAVRVDSGLGGKSNAAHATATGKAILAWLPEPEVRAIAAHSRMLQFTERTVQSIDELLKELRLVRRHGYAEDREEFQPDVWCIGSAIRDHSGAVVASVSVSIPTLRATEDRLTMIRDRVRDAAQAVSLALGSDGVPERPDTR